MLFETLGRKTLEARQQHGVQAIAPLRGNRMKGKKREHGRLLLASWLGGLASR
jgi:hypothetical protein